MGSVSKESKEKIATFVRVILADLRTGIAAWHPSMGEIAKWFDCPYKIVWQTIKSALVLPEDHQLWRQTTPAKGRNRAIKEFIQHQADILTLGGTVTHLNNKGISELFNLGIHIVNGLHRRDDKMIHLRNRAITALIQHNTDAVLSGLIGQEYLIDTQQVADRFQVEPTVIYKLYRQVVGDQAGKIPHICRIPSNKGKVSSKNQGIIDEILAQAQKFQSGEIAYLTRESTFAKRHCLSRERIRQIFNKFLPEPIRTLWKNKANLEPTVQRRGSSPPTTRILRYARRYIGFYNAGRIRHLPYYVELAERLSCSVNSVNHAMERHMSKAERALWRHVWHKNSIAQKVVDCVKQISREYQEGRIDRLPTYENIAKMCGTTWINVNQAIRRRLTEEERRPWTEHKGKKR